MPDHPDSAPVAELGACRSAAGLFDLPGTVVVRVSGPDAADYLHRRLSRSVNPPVPGSAIYACLLGGDGRMLSDVRLLTCASEDFLLVAEPCVAETLAAQIDRYVIREELVVEDISQATGVLSLDGPRAAAILGEVAGVPDATPDDGRCVRLAIAGRDVWCAAMGSIGLPGFQLLCPVSHLAAVRSELLAVLTGCGGAECGPPTRKMLRVEAGVPLFGADMDASTIPLEAGLAHAIDFDKGCFPGQEIVARIHNLGHPARVLVGLRFDLDVSAVEGVQVFAGEHPVGRVTSVVFSPSLRRTIALGIVKWDQREPGTRVSVLAASGRVLGEVTPLPFVATDA